MKQHNRIPPCQRIYLSLWIVMLCLTASPLLAQQQFASITGLVTDPSSGVVPGATVVVSNEDTGVKSRLKTDADGYYTVSSLIPGTYDVAVSMAGFRTVTRTGITLDVAQNARVDIVLAVGKTTQQIEVTGRSTLLQTETATVGQVVPQTAVLQLPLNGRDYVQLTTLVPGATADSIHGGGLGGNYYGIPENSIEVNGMKDSATSYYIDGADVSEQYLNATSITPPPDAVQEFKVLTSDMSAQYGGAGAIINVVLNSGTNSYHGDAYEFIRNDALDGRNFFALTTPKLDQNQFGASLGGPIIKNGTFFFVDYQGTRILQGATFDSPVPTMQERQGIFPTPITNPYTGQPFQNNQIPASMLSPQATYFLKFFPLPNTTAGTYIFNGINNLPTDQGDIRIDHNLRPSHRLAFTYSLQNGSAYYAGPYPDNGATSGPYRTQFASLEWTWSVSPTKLNSAHISYQRTNGYTAGQGIGINDDELAGIGGFEYTSLAYPGPPQLNIAGLQGLDGYDYNPLRQIYEQYTIGDVFTWIKGKHTLEIGGDARSANDFNACAGNSRGNFDFTGVYTGNGFADFLLGLPYQAGRSFPSTIYGVYDRDQDLFVNDTFKVTRRLTLDVGLRWDLIHPYTGANDEAASVDPYTNQITLASNSKGQISTEAEPTEKFTLPIYADQIVPSSKVGLGPSLVNIDNHAFGPRIGLAYQAHHGFVIRSGYGVFHPVVNTNAVSTQFEVNPPFSFFTLGIFNTTPVPTSTLADLVPPVSEASLRALAAPPTFVWYPPTLTDPYVQEWNFAVQKLVGQVLSVQAAYVGTQGTHQFFSQDLNVPPPGPGDIQSRRQFPSWGAGYLFNNSGISHYNALQLTAETRNWHGLYLLGAYSWSKSLDNDSGDIFYSSQQNPSNLTSEWGISDTNIPNRFTLTFIWNMPFLMNRHGLLGRLGGGWTVSNIITLQSGLPFTPVIETDPANTGTPMRPDRIGSGILPKPTISEWFNYMDFTAPTCYCYGNSARNILSGPGLRDWDFSLSKEFPIREKARVQFRAEFFNFTNTPAFGEPDTDIQAGPGVAGAIFSAGAPREVQFALKFLF